MVHHTSRASLAACSTALWSNDTVSNMDHSSVCDAGPDVRVSPRPLKRGTVAKRAWRCIGGIRSFKVGHIIGTWWWRQDDAKLVDCSIEIRAWIEVGWVKRMCLRKLSPRVKPPTERLMQSATGQWYVPEPPRIRVDGAAGRISLATR
jgi:hypothetical protein